MNVSDIQWKVGWQTPISDPARDFYEMDIYFSIQDEAVRHFGTDTLLMYQMGKFYEVYGREELQGDQDRVNAFAECCNIQDHGKKTTGYPSRRMSPPRMLGVPIMALEKYRALLLNAGWTLVIISEKQQTSKGKRLKTLREITEIVSGATHEDTIAKDYTIAGMYVEPIPISGNSLRYYTLGISTINCGTGKASIHELTETRAHLQDYVNRILLTYDPSEILVGSDEVNELFELSMYRQNRIPISKEQKNVAWLYENLFCRTVGMKPCKMNYKQRQLIASQMGIPSDIRGSEGYISLGILLQMIDSQKPDILQKIRMYNQTNTCVLYGNAIEQLAIFPKKTYSIRSQQIPSQRSIRTWDSLYSLMNLCNTRCGSRLLHYRLSHPMMNRTDIEMSHKKVGLLIHDNHFKRVRSIISNSLDGERIVRRVDINWKISPSLIHSLKCYIQTWKDVEHYIQKSDGIKDDLSSNIEDEVWEKLVQHFDEMFTEEGLTENRGIKWEFPLKPGSLLQKEKETMDQNWGKRLDYLKQIIKPRSDKSIKLCMNDGDGYTITIPVSKGVEMTKWKNSETTNTDSLLMEFKEVEMKKLKGSCKLSHPSWKDDYMKRQTLYDRIHKENCDYIQEWRETFWESYGSIMDHIVKWGMELDLLSTYSYISARYGYHCPTIAEHGDDTTQTTVTGKNLRHPMIERIQETVAGYVANDVNITDTETGMLLYGMNASGKSSYMKSLGLAIVMSQAGCWVPSEDFTHTIVSKLFTRISGNDDYLRGKSSFAVEMEELLTILRDADSSSLVLGDELCRGTEHISGSSIVGAGIYKLLTKKVPFVFATHLHDLPELSVLRPFIQKKQLGVYHLRVQYDETTGQLIYDRKLQPGQGTKLYGIEVACALGLDKDTQKISNDLREELMGFVEKKSHYNSNKRIKVCEVCGEQPATETHHIREQHTADSHTIVDGKTRLHSLSNLVGICGSCHTKHHRGKIDIEGWIETSSGMELVVTEKD